MGPSAINPRIIISPDANNPGQIIGRGLITAVHDKFNGAERAHEGQTPCNDREAYFGFSFVHMSGPDFFVFFFRLAKSLMECTRRGTFRPALRHSIRP